MDGSSVHPHLHHGTCEIWYVFRLTISVDDHQEIDDLRCKMLSSNVVEALLARLEDGDVNVRQSALISIREYAKYSTFSYHQWEWILNETQTMRVGRCWILAYWWLFRSG